MPNLWLSALVVIATQPAATTTLRGTVRDETGRPIVGADVFISTAAPRKGLGVL